MAFEAKNADMASISDMATYAQTAQNATQQQEAQCTVNRSTLPDCKAAQAAKDLSDAQSLMQNLQIVRKPSTTYSFSLPTGKPLSPVKTLCGPEINQPIINASLGESDILEIPVQNSGNKMELAINSVLTFTSEPTFVVNKTILINEL